jgi:nucleotide-binding universal stress UspA family protein
MFKRVLVGVDHADATRTPLWETAGRLSAEGGAAKDCDLILLGTHAHGAWSGALLGSVSQRVAGHAPCPVLLVPCGEG